MSASTRRTTTRILVEPSSAFRPIRASRSSAHSLKRNTTPRTDPSRARWSIPAKSKEALLGLLSGSDRTPSHQPRDAQSPAPALSGARDLGRARPRARNRHWLGYEHPALSPANARTFGLGAGAAPRLYGAAGGKGGGTSGSTDRRNRRSDPAR